MKKLLGIVVLSLMWSENLYAIQYDDFFDMFNNCIIKEKKLKEKIWTDKWSSVYKFCNLEFVEKRKYNYENGTFTKWQLSEYSQVVDKKVDEEKSRLFKILRAGVNTTISPIQMRIYSIEEKNSIDFMGFHYPWSYAASKYIVKNADVDLCYNKILKYVDIFSEKYKLKKKKWKKLSEIKKFKKPYPNGNPHIIYGRGFVYKLSDNKEINLVCKYTGEVSKKNIIWNINIDYANSDLLVHLKKDWKKYPNLNLKIIWKEIMAELYG